MLPLTKEEEIAYNSPEAICHICKKQITDNDVKCRDHDHLSGK